MSKGHAFVECCNGVSELTDSVGIIAIEGHRDNIIDS
jgi:hypothetical protein